jgi:cell division protein FtsZ
MLAFDSPKDQSSIIKVLGVGGGGGNAVNHMFEEGIEGVDFILCNTDAQALEKSPIPTKIQLGTNLTEGRGAGSKPEVGRNAAIEDIDKIKEVLSVNTKMLFITAGMGGGTGTGAAPVIAEAAKELDILSVGIVTIPFQFEGRKRKQLAMDGINEMKKYVDTILIISNDKLRELHGNLKLSEAFGKADNILTTAAKGIAEIITVTGYINVDFEDVKTVMKNSGTAIMGAGVANGENRARVATEMALNSPLLNDNDVKGSTDMLLYIATGTDNEIEMDEVSEITDFIKEQTGEQCEVIWGSGQDANLGDQISITLIATGFDKIRKKGKSRKPGEENYPIKYRC